MASKFNHEVCSIDVDVKEFTGKLQKEFEKKKEVILTKIGMTAVNKVKLITPVDTGRLRNSMTFDPPGKNDHVDVGTAVEYAPYVEYGTSKQPAHHMLERAVRDNIDEFKQIATEALKE